MSTVKGCAEEVSKRYNQTVFRGSRKVLGCQARTSLHLPSQQDSATMSNVTFNCGITKHVQKFNKIFFATLQILQFVSNVHQDFFFLKTKESKNCGKKKFSLATNPRLPDNRYLVLVAVGEQLLETLAAILYP